MMENQQSTGVTIAENLALSENAIAFLIARSIKPQTAQALGLVSLEKGNTEYILFPYGEGKYKIRSLNDKRNQQIVGGSLPLFNELGGIRGQSSRSETELYGCGIGDGSEGLANVREGSEGESKDNFGNQSLLITEGEFDALAAYQSGHHRVVSVPNGANSLSDAIVERIFDGIPDSAEIIIAADNDKDGHKMLEDTSVRLGRSRCRYVRYPRVSKDSSTRCKDLNEVLQLYGEKGVVACIANAPFVHVEGLYKMSELPEIPEKPLVGLNIEGLEKVKIRKGDWSVVSGIPANGKTTFMNCWTCSLVKNQGWKIAFASFEQPPQTDHRDNLRAWYLQTDPQFATSAHLAEADKWIDDNMVFFVANEEQDVSLEWLYEMMTVAVRRHGVDMIVIDPWNEIDHSRSKNESQTEYTGSVIRYFRRFARSNNIHLTIVAHPAKMSPDSKGVVRVPTLYDISDSAHWNNKCDIGFIVHRDTETDEALIRVEKCRYGHKLGLKMREDFRLKYVVGTRRYRKASL